MIGMIKIIPHVTHVASRLRQEVGPLTVRALFSVIILHLKKTSNKPLTVTDCNNLLVE
jgi:hypothetical protein